MYALSLGVQNIGDTLPKPAYARLSGLNSSTVGIFALAAVQLAEKVIRDQLTRSLIILGACAGLCYNALWYFPVLMVIGGLAIVFWDGWMSQFIRKAKAKWRLRDAHLEEAAPGGIGIVSGNELQDQARQSRPPIFNSATVRSRKMRQTVESPLRQTDTSTRSLPEVDFSPSHIVSIKVGITICFLFFG
jgi:hypothetical protein